jgi:hypothetical protein
VELEKIIARLRASGMAPRLAAPVDTEPPPQLKSPPPPIRVQVGRRIIIRGRGA